MTNMTVSKLSICSHPENLMKMSHNFPGIQIKF